MDGMKGGGGIIGRLRSLLGSVFNLFPLGGTTGGIVVRQKGGTPGTHEIWIYEDGSSLVLDHRKSGSGYTFRVAGTDAGYVLGNGGFAAGGSANSFSCAGGGFVADGTNGALRLGSLWPLIWNADTSTIRIVAGVVGYYGATAATPGWVQNTAGRRVLTADVTNDSATLATTGLTVDVKAGRKYPFVAMLYVTTGAVLEGVQVGLNGTSTITNLIADVEIKSHASTPVFTLGRLAAYGTAVGQTVADAGNATVEVSGTLECNAAGTLRLDFAKNADTGAANTTVKRGSWLWVEDAP